MAQKFNQLLAVEKSHKTRAEEAFTTSYNLLKNPELFHGLVREYHPFKDGDTNLPPENKVLQHRVDQQLQQVKDMLVEFFDLTATKDNTNTEARSDVEIDGHTIAKGVPATHLLWLEKKLENVLQYVRALPTLDSSQVWTLDQEQKLWRTPPTKTLKTAKVPEVLVLAPATKEHPAQVAKEYLDKPIGEWASTQLSGAIPPTVRDGLIRRVQKAQYAVKQAREHANSVETKPLKSSPILDYIFAKTNNT